MQIQQFTAMKFNLLWNKYLHIQRYTYKWKVVSVDSETIKNLQFIPKYSSVLARYITGEINSQFNWLF